MNKVAIYGGLGNQMFQYAFFLALKQKNKQTKILFTNFFVNHHHHGFDLIRAFSIPLPFTNFLSYLLLEKGSFLYRNKPARYILNRTLPFYQKLKYTVYKEKEEFEYDENVFFQKNKLFAGVWQVERYFSHIEKDIRKTFCFDIPLGEENTFLIKRISNTNSVSIHIRRGDYLKEKWKALMVINNLSYYTNSIKFILNIHPDAHFYVFSDDMDWVKENLTIPNATYVDHNIGKRSYIDMYLMSICKHNIIANSTFSWWAAWLNVNKNKVVIAPEKWINTKPDVEIYPETWIKMKI